MHTICAVCKSGFGGSNLAAKAESKSAINKINGIRNRSRQIITCPLRLKVVFAVATDKVLYYFALNYALKYAAAVPY